MATTPFIPRRPSRRAVLARTITTLILRPLEVVIPPGRPGVLVVRSVLAGLLTVSGRPARGVEISPIDTSYAGGRVRGEWTRPARARSDSVILYVHGSAYVACSTRTHRPLVTTIAAVAEVPAFSVSYRLAPEHVFPAAADDVAAAYRWLLDQGYAPAQVVVMGDSAGGHLVFDLVAQLAREGEDLPAGMVMFSPLADATFELCRLREQIRRDPMISAEGARRLVAHYIGDADPRHPRLTHVLAADETLCPALIQAGGAEMLAADAHRLADLLRASGTPVQLEVWPGQMHVFQAAARVVPEGRAAIERAARFALDALAARRSEGSMTTEVPA